MRMAKIEIYTTRLLMNVTCLIYVTKSHQINTLNQKLHMMKLQYVRTIVSTPPLTPLSVVVQ